MITDKIGSVAYKLKLPDSSSIHPVFNVSQLKIVVMITHTAQPLPSSLDGLHVLSKFPRNGWPAKVRTEVCLQALIKWSGIPASLATWEDMEPLGQRFP
jgi:hypothetical protein